MIDVALYESVFNVMESLLPEYSAFGAVREAAGSALPVSSATRLRLPAFTITHSRSWMLCCMYISSASCKPKISYAERIL